MKLNSPEKKHQSQLQKYWYYYSLLRTHSIITSYLRAYCWMSP